MNVDENPVTPSSYRVTGIPTINVYQDGEVVKSIVGAKPKAALLNELAEFIDLTLTPRPRCHVGEPRAAARPRRSGAPRTSGSRGCVGFGAGRGVGRTTPSSRSSAASTSSFQVSAERRSIRIRGVARVRAAGS